MWSLDSRIYPCSCYINWAWLYCCSLLSWPTWIYIVVLAVSCCDCDLWSFHVFYCIYVYVWAWKLSVSWVITVETCWLSRRMTVDVTCDWLSSSTYALFWSLFNKCWKWALIFRLYFLGKMSPWGYHTRDIIVIHYRMYS